MGTFNTFGKKYIQLKVGSCCMMHYDIGDKVDIPDGIYLAYEGIVVISDNGKLIAFCDKLFDKWGNAININELLNKNNPVMSVVKTKLKK